MGEKSAVTEWLPKPRLLSEMLAFSVEYSGAGPKVVLPSSKVTVPAGIPVVAVTVACNVTFCPCNVL